MFEGFAHVWTPVAFSSELRAAPLPLRVAGTKIVLFRDKANAPVALLDRCPHRGVELSLGQVEHGCIACPFHGWQLDGTGRVCHVPWNPDAKLEQLRGVAFPVRELGGQIWLFTAPGETPPEGPAVNAGLLRTGVRISGRRVVWKAHWTRAMENMLDWPHLPFVHKKTIGRRMKNRTKGRMDIAWEDRAWGAETRIKIDGEEQATTLDFRWPNQMNLHIGTKRRLFFLAVACVPVDAESTVMLLAVVRDFMTSPLFDPLFDRANLKIANEDRAIVESSFPEAVPPAGEERSVRTDAPTLAFRKRYLAELHGSCARGAKLVDEPGSLPCAHSPCAGA